MKLLKWHRNVKNVESGNTTLLIAGIVAAASFIGVEMMMNRVDKTGKMVSGSSTADLAQQEGYSALTIAQALFAAQNLTTWKPLTPMVSNSTQRSLTIGTAQYRLYDSGAYSYPPNSDGPIVYVDRYPSDSSASVGLVKTRDVAGASSIWSASWLSTSPTSVSEGLTLDIYPQIVSTNKKGFPVFFATPSTVVSSPQRATTKLTAEKLKFRNNKVYLVVEASSTRSGVQSSRNRTVKTRAELSIFEPPTPVCRTLVTVPARGFYKMGEIPTGKVLVTGVTRSIIKAEYCVTSITNVKTCTTIAGSQYSGAKNDFVFAVDADILASGSLQGTTILPSQLESTVSFTAIIQGSNGAIFECDSDHYVKVELPVRSTTFFVGNGPGSCTFDEWCFAGAHLCSSYGLTDYINASNPGDSRGHQGDVAYTGGVAPDLLNEFRARTSGDPNGVPHAFQPFGNRTLCHSTNPAKTVSDLSGKIVTDIKIAEVASCANLGAGWTASLPLDSPSIRNNSVCRTNRKATFTPSTSSCAAYAGEKSYTEFIGCYPADSAYLSWWLDAIASHPDCRKPWTTDVSKSENFYTTTDGVTAKTYSLCVKVQDISTLAASDTGKLVVYDVDIRGRSDVSPRSTAALATAKGCTTGYQPIDNNTVLDCVASSTFAFCTGDLNAVACWGPITTSVGIGGP